MKMLKRWGIPAILALLAGGCFYLAVTGWQQLRGTGQLANIRLSQPVVKERIEEIKKAEEEAEESYTMAFYKEEKQQNVAWGAGGRSERANVLATSGQTNILFRGNKSLESGDDKGCLISRDVVRELLGSGSIIGETVTIGSEDYIVRDVLEYEQSTVVIPARKDTPLDRVAIKVSAGTSSAAISEAVMNRHGLDGDALEYQILYWITSVCIWLLPLTLMVSFLIWLLKSAGSAAGKNEKVFWRVLAAGGAVLFCWMIVSQAAVPRELIPTRWSDFDFWARLIEQKKEALKVLLNAEKTVLDEAYPQIFFRSVVDSIFAVGLYFLAIICYTMISGSKYAEQTAGINKTPTS